MSRTRKPTLFLLPIHGNKLIVKFIFTTNLFKNRCWYIINNNFSRCDGENTINENTCVRSSEGCSNYSVMVVLY